MNLYVIRRRQGWRTPEELAQAAEVSSRIGNEEMPDQVRWIRTYVVREPDGQLGTLCVYQATDPEAIRDHAERVGMPSDEIAPVIDRCWCALTRPGSRPLRDRCPHPGAAPVVLTLGGELARPGKWERERRGRFGRATKTAT